MYIFNHLHIYHFDQSQQQKREYNEKIMIHEKEKVIYESIFITYLPKENF